MFTTIFNTSAHDKFSTQYETLVSMLRYSGKSVLKKLDDNFLLCMSWLVLASQPLAELGFMKPYDYAPISCFLLLLSTYVTGFAKRGLPHTSNSMNLEDHNLVFKKDANLKFLHPSTYVGAHY